MYNGSFFGNTDLGFLKLDICGSAIAHLPVYAHLDLLSEFWIEHVAIAFLYVKFVFATRIF